METNVNACDVHGPIDTLALETGIMSQYPQVCLSHERDDSLPEFVVCDVV